MRTPFSFIRVLRLYLFESAVASSIRLVIGRRREEGVGGRRKKGETRSRTSRRKARRRRRSAKGGDWRILWEGGTSGRRWFVSTRSTAKRFEGPTWLLNLVQDSEKQHCNRETMRYSIASVFPRSRLVAPRPITEACRALRRRSRETVRSRGHLEVVITYFSN